MVKSGLLLTVLLGLTKSLNGRQIIQFTRDGDNYALPLTCNDDTTTDVSFLLNLNSGNTVLAGQSKCFSYTPFNNVGVSLTSPENAPEMDVDTPFATYSGHKGWISCKFTGKGMASTQFNVVVPETCSPSDLPSDGTKDKVGLLGLAAGLNNEAFSSKFKSFGIHIPDSSDPEQGSQRGMFIYDIDFDSGYYEDGKPVVVPASMGFQMEFVNELYFGQDKELLSVDRDDIKASFDLNYAYIGLPEVVYDKVLALFKLKGLDCTHDKDVPICTYSGNVDDLPELGIGFAYGTNLLVGVDSSQYIDMKTYKETKEIKLRIRKLENVNEGYESTIVLGRAYMEKRYVTFDYNDIMHVKIRIYGKNPHMKYDARAHDTESNGQTQTQTGVSRDASKDVSQDVQTKPSKGVATGYEIKEDHSFRPPNLHPEPKKTKKEDEGYGIGYWLLAGIIGIGLLAAFVNAYNNRKRKEESPTSEGLYFHELVSTPIIEEPLKAI